VALIITRTPFRISLFGGGTDFPAWYREHGGAVIGFAIDKYCYISARRLPPFFKYTSRIVHSKIELVHRVGEIEHPAVRAILERYGQDIGLEIHHFADLPAKSGLGSSSSFTVGLLHTLRALLDERSIDKRSLAEMAIDLEQNVLKEAVGSQDQIHASYGGFNHVIFWPSGDIEVTPFILPRARVEELLSNLMLVFTGLQRYAVEIEARKITSIAQHTRALERTMAMVDEAISIIVDGDLRDLGKLLDEAWMIKSSLAVGVSTSEVEEIYATALRAGALGGKLLGAGGGGFMLLFVPPDRQPAVRAALPGLIEVGFGIDRDGSRVVLYEPNGL
jgi:D-glycero-alpha-D-manno-heptose-7-phosphate kinase